MSDSFFSSPEDPPADKKTSTMNGIARSGQAEIPHEVSEESDRSSERIAKAGQRILDQAKLSLPEKNSLVRRPAARFRTWKSESRLSEQDRKRLIVVTDSIDTPLLCLEPETAVEQGLSIRMVAVAAFSKRGTLFLQRRMDQEQESAGQWNIWTGFVHAEEAREDAALRLLHDLADADDEIPIRLAAVRRDHFVARSSPRTKRAAVNRHGRPAIAYLSLYTVSLPLGVLPDTSLNNILEVDEDELMGLAASVPDLLAPELLWAASSGLLFPRRSSSKS